MAREYANVYDEIILPNMELIKAYIRDGYSQKDIARKLGLNAATLGKHKKLHPEFAEIWNETAEKTDVVNVVGSYYRQATGYTVVEKEEKYKYIDGVKTLVAENYREKYIPPSEKATANWIAMRLKNNSVWGDFAKLLFKQSEAEMAEQGGVVLIPPKRKASEEQIIDIQVKEVVDNGGDPMDTTGQAS